MAKPKCNDQVIKRAVQLKRGGASNKDIASALGIAEGTFYAWSNKPKSEKQREFSEALKKAEADYKNALLAVIAAAGRERDWKAAAWLLERKYPSEYARTDRIQATVEQETKASVRVEHYFDYGE
jgi:transposase